MTTRRSFITGLVSFVAAPAIVRAGSLMQIRPERPFLTPLQIINLALERIDRDYGIGLVDAALRDLAVFGTNTLEMTQGGVIRHVPLQELFK